MTKLDLQIDQLVEALRVAPNRFDLKLKLALLLSMKRKQNRCNLMLGGPGSGFQTRG